MHTATRPFSTVGVSLVGAAAIALTPVTSPAVSTAIHRADVQVEQLAVQLAAYAKPQQVYNAVFQRADAAWNRLPYMWRGYLGSDDPHPIFTQLRKNQMAALSDIRKLIVNPGSLVVDHAAAPGVAFSPAPSLINALGTTAQDLVRNIVINMPVALAMALVDLLQGRIEDANNQLILAALNPIVPLLNLTDSVLSTTAHALQGVVNIIDMLGPLGAIVANPLQNLVNVYNALGRYDWAGPYRMSNAMMLVGGVIGPVISTSGALGTGVQNIVDSFRTGNLGKVVEAVSILPAIVMDGLFNGGQYGPDLSRFFDTIKLGNPAGLYAGGLLNGLITYFVPDRPFTHSMSGPFSALIKDFIYPVSRALKPPPVKARPSAAATAATEDLPAPNALPLVNAPTIALPAATAASAKTATADDSITSTDSSKTADSVKKDRHDKKQTAAAVVGINTGSDTKAANRTQTDTNADAGKGTDSGKSSDAGGSSSAGSGDKGSNTGSTDRAKGHGKGSRSSDNSSNTKPAKENTKSVKAHSAGKSSSGGHRSHAK